MSDDELRNLRRWKAEAMPVLQGLQDVGHALGVPLGTRITAKATVDKALDLRNERDAAVAQHAAWCDWLAAIGFGIDFSTDVPPPCSLAELAEAMHRDDPREAGADWAWCIAEETGQRFGKDDSTTPSPGAPAPAGHDRKA